MKNIFKTIFITLAAAVLFTSCIEETFPKGSTLTKDQLEQSEEALSFMMNGVPTALSSANAAGYYTTYGWQGDFGIAALHFALETMLEDVTLTGEMGYFWFPHWYQNNAQGSDYIYAAYFWYSYYPWIKLVNDIIGLVGEVNDDTAEDTKQILGQAHAYRAMFYLDMARLYEPKPNKYLKIDDSIIGLTVPLVTEKTTEEMSKNNPRVTREELYQFIISDLTLAAEYLKKASERYTSPGLNAVYGLLARTYLELGATYSDPTFSVNQTPSPEVWDMTSEKAYTEAAKYARKVIDSGKFSPLTQSEWENPQTGFNDGTSNNAWIWGLTVSAENVSNLIAHVAHRSCEALYGYANLFQLSINKALYTQIPEDDFRKYSWYDPDLDYNYQLAGSGTMQGNYFVYSGYGFVPNKLMSLKFRPGDGNVLDYTVGNAADYCLMRIEEMYFIEMEATLATKGLGAAQELLNNFMQTYRYSTYQCDNKTLTADAYLNEMMLQKRIEFWGEGILFYDYKRLNMGITRGYEGTNVPSTARLNCEGRSPQWNIVLTRGEFQSNSGIKHPDDNNPDPTGKIELWQ